MSHAYLNKLHRLGHEDEGYTQSKALEAETTTNDKNDMALALLFQSIPEALNITSRRLFKD